MFEYEYIIGLEVHAQLQTESKIFCHCSTAYGSPPNTQVCPVCLGLPGALPALNKRAVEYAMKMILATGGTINNRSVFARKNYFYPDLPKGYQISQYDLPLGEGGEIEFNIEGKTYYIGLIRIHLEEDAGKSIHTGENCSLIDMNRCGVPLIEIVSKPEIRGPIEAYAYLSRIKQIVQYLGICSGDMEKGALRCDANISIRPVGQVEFGTRTEIKNMNSFHGVERALSFEIDRQVEIIESGGRVMQETLLWDEDEGEIHPMRSKEESHDYRYFPEPDLTELVVSDDWVREVAMSLPELPHDKHRRFQKDYGIPMYDAEVLVSKKPLADYFEQTVEAFPNPKKVSNWVMTEVLKVLKDSRIEIEQFRVKPKQIGDLLRSVDDGTISGKIAKDVFAEMVETGDNPSDIIEKKGLQQITDEAMLDAITADIIAKNPNNVKKYRNGKEQILGFFVGELMKATKGKANPELANKVIRKYLNGA